MSFATWKLEHTPFDSEDNSYGTKVTLSDYFNPILNMKIGDGKDSFKLEVTNYNNKYDNSFNPNDMLLLSRNVNSTSIDTSDILINGALRDVPEEVTSSKSNVKMQGYNYSETIMNVLIPVLDATDLDPAETIQQGLLWSGNHNNNFKVDWNALNPTSKYSSSGVKNTGGFYSSVGKIFYYKTLKTIIEELSKEEFTEDGKYYWFVDENNTLVWDKRLDNTKYTFDDTTSNFKSLKVSKDLKDVKNYIIMKGGRDAKHSPISFPAIDYSSVSKHGFKYFVHISSTTIAGNLIDVDIKAAMGEEKSYEEFKEWFLTNNYTPPWEIDGSTTNYTTFDGYNSGLRAHIKQELQREGDEMLRTTAFGTLMVTIDRSPLSGLWILGSVVSCAISNLDVSPKAMRIEEVQYTSVLDTYILKEDKGTI